ncbi:MAG: class I SAM-dependent DNA methyltransferase [Chloroflexota bacterium]
MDETETILQLEYPLVRPYSRYADLYDTLGQSDFSQAMLLLAERTIRRHALAGHEILDLACGTGTVALLLAREGYRVTGVDRSEEMLEIARMKAREAGIEADFLRQDMTLLEMERSFDLALCFYDSLNHLLSLRDLEMAFQGVASVLKPNGLFIFDMNTVHCLAHDWGNQVVEERCASALLVHQYSYEPEARIGTLEILCLLNGKDRIEKFREIHRERGYTREEVAKALQKSGLNVLEEMAFPDLNQPDDTASRLIWVAGRQKG